MTAGPLVWLGTHQILISVFVSAVLIALIWRLDLLVVRLTNVSEETVADLTRFRGVATATMFLLTGSWIANQPNPPWLDRSIQAVNGPEIVSGIVVFLPSLVVNNPTSVLVTVFGFWWAWVLRANGDEIIERFVEKKYDETIAPIVENVWDVSVFGAFVLLMLDQWGIAITALLAPAGVIGIIVGFSARKTVANFFGSISLYADDTYSRGDFIELESGLSGTVRDISVRSTVLQTLDGDEVTIPNSELNDGKIINKSSPRPDRRIHSQIGVSYDADPDRVRAILFEAAKPLSQHREPMVHLRSFGDSALVFDVFVWIEKPETRLRVEHELNMAIYRALESAGIEIPYPQREVAVDSQLPVEEA